MREAPSRIIYLSSEQFSGLCHIDQELASPFTGCVNGQKKQLTVSFINVDTILYISAPYVAREGDNNLTSVKIKLIDGSSFTFTFRESVDVEDEESYIAGSITNAHRFILYIRSFFR